MAATASSRCPFPVGCRLKCSPTYVLTPPSYQHRFAARLLARDSPALCPVALPRGSHCPPRAPLHNRGFTAFALRSWRKSARITSPSSLILAHAPDRPGSRRLRVSLFLQVFAGCVESLLPVGPSRRYFCDPCTGAWVRTPPRSGGAYVRFFPPVLGLTIGSSGSARGTIPQRSSMRGAISGLQPFSNVQAPLLTWPTDCSDVQSSLPLPPLGRIHRAEPAPLPVAGCGIVTCLNRTTDTIELTDAFASIHLLDRSLVGCS